MTSANPSEEMTFPQDWETDDTLDNPSSHKDVIETVIASLEDQNSAMVQHNQEGYLWKFEYGSVEVLVQLTGESDDDLLTVWSPVLTLPAKDEVGLMKKLLQMNWSDTLEARFGVVDNQVIVISQRTVADLSPGEISRTVTIVATVADDNDEMLKETYGGT